MLIPFFYTANILLLLTGLAGLRLQSGERRFALTLIQVLLALPLLAGEYLYLACHLELRLLQAVIFSEVIFIFIWFSMALRVRRAVLAIKDEYRRRFFIEILAGLILLPAAGYFIVYQAGLELNGANVFFRTSSPVYFASFAALLVVLYCSWRLEQFWGGLDLAQRWRYKFLVIGQLVICGAFAWSSSYRLTYLTIIPRHLKLLAALILMGWFLMLYAVAHHQLLNRKIFVSRKIVYSFAMPSLLAAYLTGFGLISWFMRAFGLEMTFVFHWLLIISGVVGVVTISFSGKLRRRIHFFISTQFYVNKYEYRDEWLALSGHLQGAVSESETIKALRQVLVESLYTSQIYIWLADAGNTCQLVSSPEQPWQHQQENTLAADNPLIHYLQDHAYFHLQENEPDHAWHEVQETASSFLKPMDLKLLSSIAVGNQLVGLIGLGPEYTGGQYGHDDFDLLTVLGSQTASALLAAQMAEELASTREQQAWDRLSAFVLHDIKNAATMLSMLRENAPAHIHEPEFQEDMLELVDDSLSRMGRVEQRLRTLKDEISPDLIEVELCAALRRCCRQMQAKLPGVNIDLHCPKKLLLQTDLVILSSIMENIMLNAYQAGGDRIELSITQAAAAKEVLIEIIDNGPGIALELLPDTLFEPFKTLKKDGSGIGLWQVRRMVSSLGGSISALNNKGGGARFKILLPGN